MFVSLKLRQKQATFFISLWETWAYVIANYLLGWRLTCSSGDRPSYCSTSVRTHTLFSTSNPQPLKDDRKSGGYLFINKNWHTVLITNFSWCEDGYLVICVCPAEDSKDYTSHTSGYYTKTLTWLCVCVYDYCGQHTCGYVWHVPAVRHQVVLMPVQQQRLGLVQQGREGCGWQSLSSNPSHSQRQPFDWLRVWNGQPAPELSSLQVSGYHRQCLQTEKEHHVHQ